MYAQPTVSGHTTNEITQAHVALSTAYNSLKTRLIRSETEKEALKRELRATQSKPQTSDSPTMRRSPQHDRSLNPQRHEFVPNDPNILRKKLNNGLARQEPDSVHARHGSWGYANDNPHAEGQYCKLLEIQLSKVEEERCRLQEELREVRLKLTEMSLKSDQSKRHQVGVVAQPDPSMVALQRDLQQQVVELTGQNEMLDHRYRDSLREKDVLKSTIVALKKQLSEKPQRDRSPSTSMARIGKNGA